MKLMDADDILKAIVSGQVSIISTDDAESKKCGCVDGKRAYPVPGMGGLSYIEDCPNGCQPEGKPNA